MYNEQFEKELAVDVLPGITFAVFVVKSELVRFPEAPTEPKVEW